ncbi:MAG: hypothetical protein H8K09_18465, partial [Nitrospira sp.]|nr:hypothetical protein [Nitrospira sp.]
FNTPYLTHFSLYSVVKEPPRASEELFVPHASRALYYAGLTLSRGSADIFFDQGLLRIRRGAYNRIGHLAGSNVHPYTNLDFWSQALKRSF